MLVNGDQATAECIAVQTLSFSAVAELLVIVRCTMYELVLVLMIKLFCTPLYQIFGTLSLPPGAL